MKISFEKKIFIGFVINLLVVFASGWIFMSHHNQHGGLSQYSVLNWIELFLFVLSLSLLTIVYFIIRTQFRLKNVSEDLLKENKKLLQSIIDNTSNPIFIKKLNGEYLLVNKQYEALFNTSRDKIIGKTDRDFLPETTANTFSSSDFEVVKALKELKTEETIQLSDGLHTYIAVKFPLFDSLGRIYAIGGISTDITERKNTEESLKIADRFFNMNIDIMVVASKEKFIKINPAISKILGYSKDELLNQPFLKFIHPDDIALTQKEIDKLQTGVLLINFENRWICKDGSVKLLSWSASPDVASGLLYAVASDITEMKKNEDSIKAADRFFNMTQDMNIIASNEKFLKINPIVGKTLGYSDNELLNQPFLKFIHPDDIASTNKEIEKLKSGVKTINFENRFICKDGSVKWLSWTTTPDPSDGFLYAIARDITEWKETQKSLIFSEKFFNMAFDVFFLADGENIVKINPALTRIFGFEKKDIENKSFLSFVHPEDLKATVDEFKKLQSGVSVINFKARSICKDGSYKWVVWSATSDIQTGMVFAAGRDVTELIENDKMLRLILENIAEGVVVAGEDKKILMTNYVASKIFGIQDNDQLTSNMIDHFQVYYPDGKTIFPSQNLPLERAFVGEIIDDVDVVLYQPETNQAKRVLLSGRPLIDEDNKVVAAVLTIKDISKYKQLEAELKETESKYRKLIGFKSSGDVTV